MCMMAMPMGLKYIVFMIVLCSLMKIDGSLWRYEGTGNSKLTLRNEVSLEYLGDETMLQWKTETNLCRITNYSSPIAKLSCDSPGIHKVTLTVTMDGGAMEQESHYLTVEDLPGCFPWHQAKESSMMDKVRLNVWLTDPQSQETSELNDTAKTPSGHSAWLTAQFAALGLQPRIEVYNHGLHNQSLDTPCQPYNTDCSCWQCQVEHGRYGLTHLFIRGTDVPLFNCFARDTHMMLYGDVHVPSASSPVLQVLLSVPTSKPYVVKNPAIDGLAAMVASDQVLLTEDQFRTVSPLTIAADDVSTETLVGVAYAAGHVVALTNNAVYLIALTENNESRVAVSTLSADPLTGIRGRDWYAHRVLERGYDMIAVWSSTTIILIKPQEGSATASLNLTEVQVGGFERPQVVISDVAWGYFSYQVGAVVSVSEGTRRETHIYVYDLTKETWQTIQLSSEPTELKSARIKFVNRGRTSFLLWSNSTLLYQSGNDRELWVTEEPVQEVTVSRLGEVAVLTTYNTLYYGMVGSDQLLKVELGERPESDVAITFSLFGDLDVLMSINSSVVRRRVQLQSAVTSALYPDVSCNMLSFTHNMNTWLYFLDMREELVFWAAVVYTTDHPNSIQTSVEGRGAWQLSTSSEYSYHGNVIMENKTVIISMEGDFRHVEDYQQSLTSSKGQIRIELYPNNSDFACFPGRPAVGAISVDCPLGRHLRIQGFTHDCDQIDNFTVRIPAEDGVILHTTVEYDWDSWGCPLRVRSGQRYVPYLNLYDDQILVGVVRSDFVLWEEYQQAGIEYNISMAQAGCVRQAQTWESMRSSANKSLDMETVWGRHNYESCFEEEDSTDYEVLRRLDYMIFNGSNSVALKFSEDHDGTYLFTATIMDPNFSFCPLRTRFIVEVYGSVPYGDLVLLGGCILCFIALFMLVLVLSYFRFRAIVIQQRLRAQQMVEESAKLQTEVLQELMAMQES